MVLEKKQHFHASRSPSPLINNPFWMVIYAWRFPEIILLLSIVTTLMTAFTMYVSPNFCSTMVSRVHYIFYLPLWRNRRRHWKIGLILEYILAPSNCKKINHVWRGDGDIIHMSWSSMFFWISRNCPGNLKSKFLGSLHMYEQPSYISILYCKGSNSLPKPSLNPHLFLM